MGLLDALAREFLPKLLGGSGANASPLLNIITSLLTNPQTGGLGGLVDSFKGQGMGDIISSWIGTGKNTPISPEDIMRVLGSDRLRGFSEQAGLGKEEISGELASILPEIIDKLTPQGKLPDDNSLEEELLAMKQKILKF